MKAFISDTVKLFAVVVVITFAISALGVLAGTAGFLLSRGDWRGVFPFLGAVLIVCGGLTLADR